MSRPRKVKDRKDFLKRIKSAGYYLLKITKHAKYKNDDVNYTISISTGRKFCIPLHMRLLKEIQDKQLEHDLRVSKANNGS